MWVDAVVAYFKVKYLQWSGETEKSMLFFLGNVHNVRNQSDF